MVIVLLAVIGLSTADAIIFVLLAGMAGIGSLLAMQAGVIFYRARPRGRTSVHPLSIL